MMSSRFSNICSLKVRGCRDGIRFLPLRILALASAVTHLALSINIQSPQPILTQKSIAHCDEQKVVVKTASDVIERTDNNKLGTVK